jgi:hypothetical protein
MPKLNIKFESQNINIRGHIFSVSEADTEYTLVSTDNLYTYIIYRNSVYEKKSIWLISFSTNQSCNRITYKKSDGNIHNFIEDWDILPINTPDYFDNIWSMGLGVYPKIITYPKYVPISYDKI